MKTSVEWLQDKLNNVKPTEFCSIETIKKWVEQAKEMESLEKIDNFNDGWVHCEKYFKQKELYDHIGDTNEMVNKPQVILGEHSIQILEISDEEIEEQSWGYREVTKDMEIPPNEDWSNGAKWYREQLKTK